MTQEHKFKISQTLKGRQLSDEHKKNLSLSHIGQYCSEETKIKMSKAKKGKYMGCNNRNWKGGKTSKKGSIKINCKTCGKERYTYPSIMKRGNNKFCSSRCSAIWQIKHQKTKDTLIERLMENELIKRNIPYTKQVPLLGITLVDFLLPNDTVIYCDGDYWHNLPKVKQKDDNQDFMLKFHGYKVFRFWEIDIKKSAEECINTVIDKYVKRMTKKEDV